MPSGSDIGGVNLVGVVYMALALAVVFLPMLLGRPSPAARACRLSREPLRRPQRTRG